MLYRWLHNKFIEEIVNRCKSDNLLDVRQFYISNQTQISDYIRTANAKGASFSRVLYKHSLRNSLTPVITYAGPMIAFILTGSLVVEKIYGIPGIGRTFVSSITNRDYPLIMGLTIFLTYLVIIMVLVSDILYKVVNPRVELE